MGDEELDPVFICANNNTVIASNSVATYFSANEHFNPLLTKTIQATVTEKEKNYKDIWILSSLFPFFFFFTLCLNFLIQTKSCQSS